MSISMFFLAVVDLVSLLLYLFDLFVFVIKDCIARFNGVGYIYLMMQIRFMKSEGSVTGGKRYYFFKSGKIKLINNNGYINMFVILAVLLEPTGTLANCYFLYAF